MSDQEQDVQETGGEQQPEADVPQASEPVAETEPQQEESTAGTEPPEQQEEAPAVAEAEQEAPATEQQEEKPTATEEEQVAPATEKQEEAPAVMEAEQQAEDPPAEAPSAEVEEVKSKEPEIPERVNFRSTDPRIGVDLAIEKDGVGSAKPVTVGEMFKNTLNEFPDKPALFFKEGEQWNPVLYSEYYDLCIRAAKSFKKLGLEKFQAVGIIGFNSPEWFYSCIGAIFAGGLAAGFYTTNGPEACQFVASDCKANIIVVENQKQLDKILQIRDQLPDLKAIVQYKGKLSEEYKDVYDWESFMKVGEDVETNEIEEIISAQKPEQACLLIYTSGTTGNPKGVMISHDNLTWTSTALFAHENKVINWTRGMASRIISYLPLSHIAGQVADIWLPMYAGASVYFAQPDALKGSLRNTLVEVKPTFFFGVPRVYEKFMEAMQHASASVTGLKKKLGVWATGKGFQGNVNIQNKRALPWGWTIANSLVLDKVKDRIGFGDSKAMHVGAAPVHRSVLEFFMKYNLPVLELYGMSENTGPATLNTIQDWRLGTVGKVMTGTKLKLDNIDENNEGEICMYGRHVFMGYLNNPAKTSEAIDEEGWLHSGDIGKIDKDGFVSITGRIKELIITSGGENVAPVPIEARIKAEVPFLSNVMVIGDKRKYLSCVVTLKCVVDLDTGEPKDELLPQVATALQALGCSLTKPSEIAKEKNIKVMKRIRQGLDKANQSAVSNAQKIQRFTILKTDFSLPGGELGPTLKLKRRVVVQNFESEIEAMYDDAQYNEGVEPEPEPVAEAEPKTEEPAAEPEPKTEEPAAEPKTEEPATEPEPKTEEPATEPEPKTEEPAAEGEGKTEEESEASDL